MDTLVRLQAKMKHDNIPAILVMADEQRFYLSGFKSSAGFMMIFPDEAFLYTDSRYFEAAKQRAKGLSYEVRLHKGRMSEHIKTVMADKHLDTLYFEDDLISFANHRALKNALEGIELKEMGTFISDLRMIKTPREIECIRRAQKVSEEAFLRILPNIREGVSERDIALMLEWDIRRLGMDIAFDFIVVGGENSSKPHGVPTDRLFRQGDFITIDFGAKLDGYCADMTRTLCIGKPSDEMREVYDTVLRAKNEAQKIIKAGLTGRVIDAAARDVITYMGYGENFGHSLGHGVGVVVHEQPNFSPSYDKIIPEGSIVSVEPGIYLEGRFGVRIEDLVLVTKDGCENLNSMTTELIEL